MRNVGVKLNSMYWRNCTRIASVMGCTARSFVVLLSYQAAALRNANVCYWRCVNMTFHNLYPSHIKLSSFDIFKLELCANHWFDAFVYCIDENGENTNTMNWFLPCLLGRRTAFIIYEFFGIDYWNHSFVKEKNCFLMLNHWIDQHHSIPFNSILLSATRYQEPTGSHVILRYTQRKKSANKWIVAT